MARIPFQDSFDTLDTSANWSGGSYNYNTFTADGELHMLCPSGTTTYHGLVSSGGHDLTGNQTTIQIIDAGDQSLTGFEFYPLQLYITGDTTHKYWWYIGQNYLSAHTTISGTSTQQWGANYDPTQHVYLRIRESGGTIYWGYSADGSNWTEPFSMASAFTVTSMKLEITVGCWETETSDSTAVIDNLNYLPGDPAPTPPAPVIVTAGRVPFTDTYDTLDTTTKYGGAYNTNSITANGTLNLGTYANDTSYHGLGTTTGFDLTGQETTIQLVDPGNQSLQSFELYPIQLYPIGDSNDNFFWYVSQHALVAYLKVSGNSSRKWSATYNASVHKYLRIRESGGTVYWGYSTDGSTWYEMYNYTYSWSITNMKLEISVGTWQAETATSTAVLDNLNILPNDNNPVVVNSGFFNFF